MRGSYANFRSPMMLVLGGLSATGFAPWSAWPITLIGMAGLMYGLLSLTPGLAFRRGWCFGFGLGLISLTWLVDAFAFQDRMPPTIGWLALILLAGYTAIYWGIVSSIAVRLNNGSPLLLAVTFAATFVFAEWSRGFILSGFPWNPLGAIWIPVQPVLSAAAVIGALGLSGATAFAAGLGAALLRGSAVSGIALVAIVIALISAGSVGRVPVDTDQPISIVQANIGQDEKWRPGAASHQIDRYVALTAAPDQRLPLPRMVFWPEAAVTLPVDSDFTLRRQLVENLKPGELLVTGAIGHGEAGNMTNSVFVLDATGGVVGRYDKRHLVPFGEYLPLPGLFARLGLSRLVPGSTGFQAGDGSATVLTAGHRLGVAICYEIIFASGVINGNSRPQFLFNPSNDAWFGENGPPQHLAQARLRAVEQGLPVIRATPTGISAVVRADGSVAASLPTHKPGRLDAMLPSARSSTPYSRWGDRIPLIMALPTMMLFLVKPGLTTRHR